MTVQELRQVYQKCLAKWGTEAQLSKAQEELKELRSAIAKVLLWLGRREKKESLEFVPDTYISSIIEEIVDSEYMIDQVKFMLERFRGEAKVKDLYNYWRSFKLSRLKSLLED